MPSVTKSRAFCLGPPYPPNEPRNFLCEMAPHIILKSVMLTRGGQWGRGGPSPKVRAYCNKGWPDVRQSLPIDCLPTLNKPHPYSPKTKERIISLYWSSSTHFCHLQANWLRKQLSLQLSISYPPLCSEKNYISSDTSYFRGSTF